MLSMQCLDIAKGETPVNSTLKFLLSSLVNSFVVVRHIFFYIKFRKWRPEERNAEEVWAFPTSCWALPRLSLHSAFHGETCCCRWSKFFTFRKKSEELFESCKYAIITWFQSIFVCFKCALFITGRFSNQCLLLNCIKTESVLCFMSPYCNIIWSGIKEVCIKN